MEKHAFDTQLIHSLQKDILKILKEEPGPHYAAFDADGTLWNNDLGEGFFQYQIDHCNLKALQGLDPWDYYDTTKKVDPPKAYLWLAQISAGHSLQQVRQWAKQAVEKSGAKVFQSQKNFIAWLQSQGIEVFIVTASVQWAVEPAAHLVGIDSDHVLGIQTRVDSDGLVTQEQFGPITWRAGKATALLERTQGKKPLFCAGNTYGDTALLEISNGARLCVQTQVEENFLFEEENKLYQHAIQNGWPVHHFFKD